MVRSIVKKSALLVPAIMNGVLGYAAKQESWLTITESLKWHIPQRTTSAFTAKNSQYDWTSWRKKMTKVGYYAVDRSLFGLVKLLITNGVLHVIEGRVPDPDSKENWKKFALNTVNFKPNKEKLAKIQIVRAIFDGMKKGFFNGPITALEDDLRILMIGTLASDLKTGCLSAGLYELSRSLFQHIHLKTLIEKISQDRFFPYWILMNGVISIMDLVSAYFENKIFQDDKSPSQQKDYQPFAKEWELYIKISSFAFGILSAVFTSRTQNTQRFAAYRMLSSLPYFLRSSMLIGIESGISYSLTRLIISEQLYYYIRSLRSTSWSDKYKQFFEFTNQDSSESKAKVKNPIPSKKLVWY